LTVPLWGRYKLKLLEFTVKFIQAGSVANQKKAIKVSLKSKIHIQ